MGVPHSARPDVDERVGLDELRDPPVDEIAQSVGRRLLEQTERADRTRREPQPGDPVDHIAGDLIVVDLVIDRGHRLVDDEALDLRIVASCAQHSSITANVETHDPCARKPSARM